MVLVNVKKDILMMKMIFALPALINKDICILIVKMEIVEMEF